MYLNTPPVGGPILCQLVPLSNEIRAVSAFAVRFHCKDPGGLSASHSIVLSSCPSLFTVPWPVQASGGWMGSAASASPAATRPTAITAIADNRATAACRFCHCYACRLLRGKRDDDRR